MKLRNNTSSFRIIIVAVLMLGVPHLVWANSKMQNFLLSSAYGTAIGAGVGAAALLFSEKPEEKLNLVARGASLGLYAGMGWGLYTNYQSSQVQSYDFGSLNKLSPPSKQANYMIQPRVDGSLWFLSTFSF